MLVRTRIDVGAELQRAFELLQRRWVLAVPPAVASLLFAVFVVFVLFTVVAGLVGAGVLAANGGVGQPLGALVGLGSLSLLLVLPLLLLLAFVANALTVVAAEDAWEGRAPDFGRAFGVVLRKLPDLLVAGIAIFLLAIVPAILSLVGIGLVLLLVLGYLTMYALPAIVLGGESGLGALSASYRLVRSDWGTSAIVYAVMLGVVLAGQIANALMIHLPLVNFVASFAIGGFTTAYTALIAARFYALQRAE
ncbi:MAG: hypothetical protein QOI11_1220 [Candidatus Eremiobacteraeota bacterium]|jgi:hypothetical protein|nr:hypothetical protein [Candidatus Eremiobacteraeota bacterium]